MSVHETIARGCEPACPGCRHRTLTLDASLDQKRRYLGRVLEAWSGSLEAVHSAGPEARYGYRDRVTLNARWDAATGWRFGLMRRDELIAIHDCPVHSVRINALLRQLRAQLPAGDRLPLAFLHVAGAQATLIAKGAHVPPGLLDPLVAAMPGSGLEGLWLHCHPSAGRRLFARSGWRLLWGSPRSIGHGGLVHGPTSFQQLLPALHVQALDRALGHLAPAAGDAVLDLYCGLGASLRSWTGAGAAALGVELGGDAVDCARLNAPGSTVLRGTCVQRLPQIRAWWHGRVAGARTAYVNPPRSGLEPELLQTLAGELLPSRIAYLSCSAGTLARDLGAFEAQGYRVRRLVPFDFFPGTQHVECLALLGRSPAS